MARVVVGIASIATRQKLEQAFAIFRRLGARRDVERTERALAALP